MGKYRIKVYYETGDSFHNEDTSGFLEMSWDNLDIAKENLQAIKEHYEMYSKFERRYGSYLNNLKVLEESSKKSWFVGEKNRLFVSYKGSRGREDWCVVDNTPKNRERYKDIPHEYRYNTDESIYCMKLKADNGNYMQQHNFWCGYFERLQSAEIVSDTSDLKIEF